MKPGFALNLSHDIISLLQRSAEGWVEVGRADLSDPALNKVLRTLRRKATTLAPNNFITKLILPESQILYLEIVAPGPDNARRRQQIAAALEGRTPYAADELVFDWSGTGSKVQVAVVAKVTLKEAEAFAEGHRFRPVAFVTTPGAGTFAGEPFFGQTTRAGAHLPPGEKLDRDQDPVNFIPPLAPAAAGPETAAPAAPDAGSLSEGPFSEARQSSAAGAPLPEKTGAATPSQSTVNAEAAQPGDLEPRPTSAVLPANMIEDPDIDRPATEAAVEPNAGPEAAADTDEPVATDAGSDATTASTEAIPPSEDAPSPAEPAFAASAMAEPEAEAPQFRSRRDAAAELADTPAMRIATGDIPAGDGGISAGHKPRISLTEGANVSLPPAEFAAEDVAAGDLGVTLASVPVPQSNAPTAPILVAERDAATSAGLFGRALLKTLPDTRTNRPGPIAPRLSRQNVLAATDLSRFINRHSGKALNWPYLGVGAALVVTLVLVITILWAMWPTPDQGAERPAAAREAPAEPVSAEAAATGPQLARQAPVALPTPDLSSGAADASSGNGDRPEETAARAALPDLHPPVAAADVAAAKVASPASELRPRDTAVDFVGQAIWQNPPVRSQTASPDAPGAPLIAGLGRAETRAAGFAFADPGLADIPPAAQPLPPPFGTIVQFTPDGLIVATPGGVVTGDGITLIAGRPPVVPTPRPDEIAALAEAAANTVPPNPLAGKTPRPRPAGLAPLPTVAPAPESGPEPGPDNGTDVVADALANDIAAAVAAAPPPDPADPAHAALKPRVRPETIVARAAARHATQAAIAEAAEAAARAEAAASVLAVASSRRPSARPQVFAKAVEAALADAVAAPEAVSNSASAAVEIDEPEPTHDAPNIPTSVTVSKQATIKNAIDLGKINLIGIYGSSSNRRALVRMANGKYVKLKIGDRFDGGQVAAIGDNELSYVKKGRTIVLKILKNS